MIIKIGKKKYPCKAEYSKTQMGNALIRIISETAPVATNGFTLYSDDESVEIDKSDYTFLYQQYGTVNEYTNVEEERVPASGYISGVPINPISKALSNLNNRITAITPYEQSKTAYVYDTEVVFENVPTGNVSVYMVGADGKNVEHEVTQENGNVIVSFKKRETLATVTLSINQ